MVISIPGEAFPVQLGYLSAGLSTDYQCVTALNAGQLCPLSLIEEVDFQCSEQTILGKIWHPPLWKTPKKVAMFKSVNSQRVHLRKETNLLHKRFVFSS